MNNKLDYSQRDTGKTPWAQTAIHTLFFLSSFVLLAYYCQYGFNEADEGIPLNGAIRILNGELPWRNFQGYLPGIYVLHALIFKTFGMDILIVRRVMVFFIALIALMILRVSERIMPFPFALLAACLYLVAPGVYYAQYIAFFSILSALVFARYCENKPNALLHLGLVLGITCLFRHEVGTFLIATTLASIALKNVLGNDRKTLLADMKQLALGFSIIAVPVLFYIAKNNLWQHVNIVLIIFNKNFVASYSKIALPFPQYPRNSIDECALFYFPILIYLTAIIALAISFLKKRFGPQESLKLYILLIGILTFNQAIWRTQPENILKTIVPAFILYGFFSYRLVFRFQNITAKTLFAISVLILPTAYAHTMITKYPFYLSIFGTHKENYQRMDLKLAHVYAGKHIAQVFPEVVAYIQSHTREQDPVYIMPFLGVPIYYLSERRNPNFFEWFLPPDTTYYPDAENAIAQALEKNRIDLLIYNEYALDGREERRFMNYAPNYYRYIFDHYYLDETIGDYWMMRKGESNIAAMQSTHNGTVIPLLAGQKAGQSFVSRLARLDEIKVKVASPSVAGETLILRLFDASAPTQELARVEATLSDSFRHQWIGFAFPEIPDSSGKSFYFSIESGGKSPGNVAHLMSSSVNRYQDGSLYKDDRPEEGDLTFIALAQMQATH